MEKTAIARAFSKLSGQIALLGLLIIVNLLIVAFAEAATYYVATNGSDSNPGTISQPFRTVGKGTSALKSGDTLYLRGGTYDAAIGGWDIPAGLPGQHTTMAGYANEKPVIRPSSFGYVVVLLSTPYVTVQDFTIDAINGGPDSGCAYLQKDIIFQRMTCLNAARDGIRPVDQNVTIRDSHIKDCGRVQTHLEDTKGGGIHANTDGESNTSNLLIEGNLIEGCRAGGIWVQQQGNTRNVVVRNNIIRNFGNKSTWPQTPGAPPQYGTGIAFAHGSHYYAYNNLIYNAGRSSGGFLNQCFLTWGGGNGRPHGSFYYIYNNTCHDADVGIQMWDQSNNVTARNNIFSRMGQVVIFGNGANNTNSNYIITPLFVNPDANDFHLQSGSLGIDQGANLAPVVTTDIVGIARPQNGSYDIGAYEYLTTTGTSVATLPSSPINVQVITQ